MTAIAEHSNSSWGTSFLGCGGREVTLQHISERVSGLLWLVPWHQVLAVYVAKQVEKMVTKASDFHKKQFYRWYQ